MGSCQRDHDQAKLLKGANMENKDTYFKRSIVRKWSYTKIKFSIFLLQNT